MVMCGVWFGMHYRTEVDELENDALGMKTLQVLGGGAAVKSSDTGALYVAFPNGEGKEVYIRLKD